MNPRRGPTERAEERVHPNHKPLAERILDTIPTDRWVTASEIAAQVGVSSYAVAGAIRSHLLPGYVERRRESYPGPGRYLYRCLARMGEGENPSERCPSCGASRDYIEETGMGRRCTLCGHKWE